MRAGWRTYLSLGQPAQLCLSCSRDAPLEDAVVLARVNIERLIVHVASLVQMVGA